MGGATATQPSLGGGVLVLISKRRVGPWVGRHDGRKSSLGVGQWAESSSGGGAVTYTRPGAGLWAESGSGGGDVSGVSSGAGL